MISASDFSITSIRKKINGFLYFTNRTHYLKFPLRDKDPHWSIRYYFNYDNKPEYNHKWVLKHHIDKIYIILTLGEALRYIHAKAYSTNPLEIWSVKEGKHYRRSIINHDTFQSEFILEPNKNTRKR